LIFGEGEIPEESKGWKDKEVIQNRKRICNEMHCTKSSLISSVFALPKSLCGFIQSLITKFIRKTSLVLGIWKIFSVFNYCKYYYTIL